MNKKYELQDTTNPHNRIVVTDPKQVREMLRHGWELVQANVTKVEAKK